MSQSLFIRESRVGHPSFSHEKTQREVKLLAKDWPAGYSQSLPLNPRKFINLMEYNSKKEKKKNTKTKNNSEHHPYCWTMEHHFGDWEQDKTALFYLLPPLFSITLEILAIHYGKQRNKRNSIDITHRCYDCICRTNFLSIGKLLELINLN